MSDDGYFWPSDMLAAYKNISCMAAGKSVTVSINAYRNSNKPTPQEGGTKHAELVKDGLLGASRNAAISRLGGPGPLVDVFTGKGSPWGIAETMSAIVDYSDNYIKLYGKLPKTHPQGHVASLLADDSLSWQQTLQTIADTYLGLDCNGFAGNWLRLADPHLRLGPQQRADDVRRKAKATRKSLGEIEYWDVMCYTKNEHIAIVEKRAESPGRFWVVQSAGGGPRMNEYSFLPAGTNAFRLGAPTKLDVGNAFYVISLW